MSGVWTTHAKPCFVQSLETRKGFETSCEDKMINVQLVSQHCIISALSIQWFPFCHILKSLGVAYRQSVPASMAHPFTH